VLKRMEDLPADILGIEAHGKLTREDYETVMVPLFAELRKQGKQARFLYRVGADFDGYTMGGVWEDLRLGMRYLRQFERCAIVSDVEWITKSAQLMGPLMPCPVKTFKGSETSQAVAWLEAAEPENLTVELKANEGVVVVEPKGPLSATDFDRLAAKVDPWLDAHFMLHGVVVHAKKFPGWENLGGLLKHFQFVRGHQDRVERVAVAVDGTMAQVLPKIATHFVRAEVKAFGYDALDSAVAWAAGSK
jgi:hypothetical protein